MGGNAGQTIVKRFWTYAGLICLLLASLGCGTSYQLARTVNSLAPMPDGRVFPSKPKFTVLPEPVATGAGIDFEAVYYLDHRTLPGVSSDGGSYLRFWPDGRVMEQFAGGKPTATDADSFYGAWMGYYRIKEGKLEIELFAPKLSEYRWTYWRVEAVLEGDLIRSNQEEINRRVKTIDRSYFKLAVPGMKRMPDW